MTLLQRFRDHIRQQQLFSAADQLLLAVSGGVDSVVLAALCREAGYSFAIAHCNFQLRGAESERDKAFVKELALQFGVPFHVKDFDTTAYAAAQQLSIQEAARELRYRWFDELLHGSAAGQENSTGHLSGSTFLLTAHHADDNTETLLLHFFRGTGLKGLTGIPEKNGRIRRPLLPFTRQEINAFAKEQNLQWVEDSSNDSSKYTRNYIRNELIPALEKIFPQVRHRLQDTLTRLKEIAALYELTVGQLKAKIIRRKGEELHIPIRQLLGYQNRALIYAIIADYGFSEKQIGEVIKLAQSESGHYIDSPAAPFRIIRHRHWLIISPVHSEKPVHVIIESGTREVRFPGGTLRISQKVGNQPGSPQPGMECFDAASLAFPLLLRPWKTGDYFYPLGMKKKKKLARFLIDQKLSKTEKEKTWVLESNRRIVWVVGHRIDERCKVTNTTREVIRMEWVKGDG